ncbi:MAG: glycosyltransferase family protein [Methylotetracoccus sp.]
MSADFLIVVQARTGSTRLPGKVLLDLGGRPVLARMIERLRFVRTPAQIVVATTTDSEDDAIATVARDLGVSVFRGHATDLLDRHYRAAVIFGARAVVKIPSDCPLIDPAVVDRVLSGFAAGDCDYASNLHPASDPDGNDVEVIAMSALESAWRESHLPMEREHTTPFIWERPERFRLANLPAQACGGAVPPNRSLTHRWTLDYPEDYLCIRRIFEELYPRDPCFGIPAIIELLSKRPDIAALNARFNGVNWYRDHLHLLKTVDARDTRRPGPVGSKTSRCAGA